MSESGFLHLDEVSLLGTFDAHFTARALDQRLREWGLSFAPLPEASMNRSLGELLSAPSAIEASPRAGRFIDRVVGLVARLADGRELTIRPAPRKAVGPDLLHAFVGARNAIGKIIRVTLRVDRSRPTARIAFTHPSLVEAVAAACELLHRGARPFDLAIEGHSLIVTVDELSRLAQAEALLAARIAADFGGAEASPTASPARPRLPFSFAVRLGDLPKVAAEEACTAVVAWHAFGAVCLDDRRPPVVTLPPAGATDPIFTALAHELHSLARGTESR